MSHYCGTFGTPAPHEGQRYRVNKDKIVDPVMWVEDDCGARLWYNGFASQLHTILPSIHSLSEVSCAMPCSCSDCPNRAYCPENADAPTREHDGDYLCGM